MRPLDAKTISDAAGALPSGEEMAQANARKRDNFYTLPRHTELFVQRCAQELPTGYCVAPFTINRSVSLFSSEGIYLWAYLYEEIEWNVIDMLDLVVARATRHAELSKPPVRKE